LRNTGIVIEVSKINSAFLKYRFPSLFATDTFYQITANTKTANYEGKLCDRNKSIFKTIFQPNSLIKLRKSEGKTANFGAFF